MRKTGTTVNNRDTVAAFGSPMSLGVGFSYVYDKRLTVGADFTFQKWSSVTYMNEKNAFCNRTKIAVGAEFLPNPMGRSYLAHVKYRLGAYYSQPYYKINGMRAADEYGGNCPFRTSHSAYAFCVKPFGPVCKNRGRQRIPE